VIAVVLGWALAGEQIGVRTVVGAAVIVGAVALLSAVRRGGGTARGAPADGATGPDVPQARRLLRARRPPPPAVARAACPACGAISEPEAPAA
jgi:hypothetical protein